MKKLLKTILIVLLLTSIPYATFAQEQTKAWYHGYFVDYSVPITHKDSKLYVPVDQIAKYMGFYAIYKPSTQSLLVAPPSPFPEGHLPSITEGNRAFDGDDDGNGCRYFSDTPWFENGHMYLTLKDASAFFEEKIVYDKTSNVIGIGDTYSPNASVKTINIIVNGKKMPSNLHPFIQDSRTMVPLRFVSETLGAEVYWHPEIEDGMQGVSVSSPNDPTMAMTLYIDKCVACESELFFRNNTFPVIRNSTTYVPLRFISDYLGVDVKWDNLTQTVILTKKKIGNDLAYQRMSKYLSSAVDEKFELYMSSSSGHESYAYLFD